MDAIALARALRETLYEPAGKAGSRSRTADAEVAIGPIRADPRQRQALLEVYRSFTGRRTSRRPCPAELADAARARAARSCARS